jgi:hypothetical protein
VLQLLRGSVLQETQQLRKGFLHARPFRHLVIDEFLAENFCQALCSEFPAFEERNARNELGVVGRKAVVQELPTIGPAYRQFDEFVQSRDFLALLGELTGIPSLLYDPDYFGGGTHENRSGQELDIHIDFNYHPRTRAHRRLNLIVFLNPEWDEAWGGSLELHQDPWGDPSEDFTVSVLPLRNRCVIFETTGASWHGFRKITIPDGRPEISRRSIAVYFYTWKRPREEIAPRHSTVYVPQRAPGWAQEGHTLTVSDAETLQVLFHRRDDQIRFLYERETEMTQVLDMVVRSTTYRLARLMTAPARLLGAAIRTFRRTARKPPGT